MPEDQAAALDYAGDHADKASVGGVARRASLESARSYASWYSSESEPSQPALPKDDSKDPHEILDQFLKARSKQRGPLPKFEEPGINREYVQALMDYMYNAVEVPGEVQEGQSIVVYSQERAGFGDIYFGAKIANLLKRALRHCDVHCVINLATQDGLPAGLVEEYFAELAGPPGKFSISTIGKVKTWNSGTINPTVVVSGPAGSLDNLDGLGFEDPPLILSPEYGKRWTLPGLLQPSWRVAPTGADKDEYGLVLEPTFLATPKKRLDLKEHNPALATNVKKGEYYFAYVNGEVKIVNESGSKVENNSHLHVLNFIRRYRKESDSGNKPNSIVFAGGNTQRERLKEALKQIGDYSFKDLSDNAGNKSVKKGKNISEIIHIYFQKMTHRQLLSAIQNSHRIRFVTGDQSLSEALSLDDSFVIYEVLEHKPKSYRDLMTHFGPMSDPFMLTEYTPAAQFQVDLGLKQDKTASITKVHSDLNFQHRIVGAVKGYVLRSRDSRIRSLDQQISGHAEGATSAGSISYVVENLVRELDKL